MAGVLIPFLPMTSFDFTFLTTGSKSIVIQPALNVIPYYYARMIIRVHQVDITASRSIKVSAYGTDPSKEDPYDFTLGTSNLEVTIDSTTSVGIKDSAPGVTIDTDTDLFPFLKIVVTGVWATGTGKHYAVLSGDLVLREA